MKALSIIVKILCAIPLLTGLLDLVLGASALSAVAAKLSAEALGDPNLNTQIRFFGAIWLGFGVLLWRVSNDLIAQASTFRVMCGILIVSGLGRLISLFQFGMPVPPFMAALVVELVLVPVLLIWHKRLTT